MLRYKVSLIDKEDVNVLDSTSSDSDISSSRKEVPGVQDAADSMKMSNKTATSLIPLDSKTHDGSPYTKMKGLLHCSVIYVKCTITMK
jgi:hypothetical protein